MPGGEKRGHARIGGATGPQNPFDVPMAQTVAARAAILEQAVCVQHDSGARLEAKFRDRKAAGVGGAKGRGAFDVEARGARHGVKSVAPQA